MVARRSLALLVKEAGNADTKKSLSIVEQINKGCVEGITESGAFSVLGIKRKLTAMLKELDKGDFNRDKFFKEFNSLYTLVMAPAKRASGVFHPSQLLDGCSRCYTYDLMGTEPSDSRGKTFPAEIIRTFDVGTWYHLYIQNILYNLGLLEQAEVPVVDEDAYLCGSADGVFKKEVFGEKVVLEIKTMNNWNYQKAQFTPFKKHELQASIYARKLGASKILYLYINKDTSEIKEFLRPLNEEQLAIADKKMNEILKCVKTKTLPPRTCKDKYCDNAMSCPFATLCFSE